MKVFYLILDVSSMDRLRSINVDMLVEGVGLVLGAEHNGLRLCRVIFRSRVYRITVLLHMKVFQTERMEAVMLAGVGRRLPERVWRRHWSDHGKLGLDGWYVNADGILGARDWMGAIWIGSRVAFE